METRIYIAVNHDTVRLIDGANQAQVGRHIAKDWKIRPATPKEVAHYATLQPTPVVVEEIGND